MSRRHILKLWPLRPLASKVLCTAIPGFEAQHWWGWWSGVVSLIKDVIPFDRIGFVMFGGQECPPSLGNGMWVVNWDSLVLWDLAGRNARPPWGCLTTSFSGRVE
jgi:hypothetical protein